MSNSKRHAYTKVVITIIAFEELITNSKLTVKQPEFKDYFDMKTI